MTIPVSPKPIFISYAHKDNENSDPAKRWLDRLKEHLKPLVQQDNLTVHSDQDIGLGDDWHEHIQTDLNCARAAVLLVSPAFLASEYIHNNELPVLLRNAKELGVKIIPVILRPCLFQETKFKYPDPISGPEEFTLASLQAAGSPNKALSEMTEGEQDRALLSVAKALIKLAQKFLVGPSTTAMPQAPVDFVIITPLAEERDAVLARLPNSRKLPPAPDHIRVYYAATVPAEFPDGTRIEFSVIVAPLANMGHTEAATATADAIRHWQPRYVLLVGIAGGIANNKVKLGDVLLSDQVADYEMAKVTADGPEIRWQVHRVDPRLLIAAQNFDGGDFRNMKASRPDNQQPQIHIGPICTGNKVIAEQSLAQQLQDVWKKLIGVEMEAGGVANAAWQSVRATGFFMIRGVSDLADGNKDSDEVRQWRSYACEIAAAWTIEFLKSGPVPPPAQSAQKTSPHQTEPMDEPKYRGKAKLEVCNRLGNDWSKLADILEIPAYERRVFKSGEEARAIWEWLENRKNLKLLEQALIDIGRDDLAEVLKKDPK